MKRIFTLSGILVASGILLQSCGTHMTIAKRQHSKGYYVDISSDRKSADKKIESKDLNKVEEIELANENPKTVKPSKTAPVHVVKNVEEKTEAVASNETVNAEKNEATAPGKTAVEKNSRVAAEKSIVNVEKSDSKVSTSTLKNGVKKFSESKQMKKMESHRATDGLSLFWIVILILLILYFLGLLGGLGWFIHLALVVALILLILWLLGIV